MEILTGFEAKVINFEGGLDLPPICRELGDFIIGSVHSIPNDDKEFQLPLTVNPLELEKKEFELTLAMLTAGELDILGHAGGMSLAISGEFNFAWLEEIIKSCEENNIVFEMNIRYHQGILSWLLEKLAEYNPLVCFGSDAHSLNEIGSPARIYQKIKVNC